MTELKLKLRKVFTSHYVPFAMLFIVLLVFFLRMETNFSDDKYFGNVFAKGLLWEHTVKFFNTWSARTLVEAVTIIIGGLPRIFWKISTPFIIAFSTYALTKLIKEEKNKELSWVTCAFVYIYSWQAMCTAGWLTTTMVFVWPLGAMLFALLSLQKQMDAKQVSKLKVIVSALFALYATNMEQVNVAFSVILISLLVYLIYKKIKVPFLLIIYLIISGANYAYAFLCPGTQARFENEVITRNKDFWMLSFFSKVEKGFSSMMSLVVFEFCALAMVFCVLIILCVWLANKNIVYKGLTIGVFGVVLVFGTLQGMFVKIIPYMNKAINFASINPINSVELTAYLPFLLLCLMFGAWFICIYLALGHNINSVVAIVVLFAGQCSRMALGFSPTLHSSGSRTAFFFMISLAFVCMLLYRRLQQINSKTKYIVWAISAGFILNQTVIMIKLVY